MELYDRVVDPDLLVRRVTIVAAGIIPEKDIPAEQTKGVVEGQLDLFSMMDTEEEKAALQAVDLAAPENAVIAISSVSPEEVLWFDLENAKAIVSHTDPLIIKGSEMITTEGTVVAKAL